MMPRVPVVIKGTLLNQGGEAAGLKEGDRMVAVNGVSTPAYTEFTTELLKHKGQTIALEINRDGRNMVVPNVPVDGDGKLGILLADMYSVYNTQTLH